MLKLYKRVGGVLHYHEAWENEDTITEHWGKVGERGEKRDHSSDAATIESVLAGALADAFEPFEGDDVLIVEFATDGMGTESDLEKRHNVESELNELLGWTGLGHCDGGSIGSGTMEVCCLVVDFPVARRVIEEHLKGTQFGDFSRIYEEA